MKVNKSFRHSDRLNFLIVLILAFSLSQTGCSPPTAFSSPVNSAKQAEGTAVKFKKTNWPLYRANAQATGVATGTLPQKLSRLWKFSVKEEVALRQRRSLSMASFTSAI